MYCINVMYPNLPGSTFDWKHYAAVHMPMGIGLLHEHFGILPDRILVCRDTYGPDRTIKSAAYHCIAQVFFEKKRDADRFIDLFNMELPLKLLKTDWPKYTAADPVAVLGLVEEWDPKAELAKSRQVLETARRELAETVK